MINSSATCRLQGTKYTPNNGDLGGAVGGWFVGFASQHYNGGGGDQVSY